MRKIFPFQAEIGNLPIEEIRLDPKSRDDIPALLLGLQYLYTHKETRKALFDLLEKEVLPGVDLNNGRPGMTVWGILVMGILKQGLNCDFDRLHELVNKHIDVQAFLGHGVFHREYQLQQVIDNVSLLRPEVLAKVNQLVVETGHRVSKKKPGEKLLGRCDSFAVETNVHHPTDVSLLYDAMRALVRTTAREAEASNLPGWRQSQYRLRKVKQAFNRVRRMRQAQTRPAQVKAYLESCQALVTKAHTTLEALSQHGGGEAVCARIQGFIDHAERQIDQISRRLLHGEAIPHGEKVFSIFEPHTRWNAKGKAGRPVELGVPVCILEDQHQFILHHRVLWKGGDTAVAVPMITETQALYPDLTLCSFDKGFHSPENRIALDALLEHNVLPRKGRLTQADREREGEATFQAARRQHPAIESAINNLEHRGLDRVCTHGAEGFERTVSLSILAFNVHRLGLILCQQLCEKEQPRRRRAA